jgi:SAM-dependent methyltransferase
MTRDADEQARRLAGESFAADDPTGWFERLYQAADAGEASVPWSRGEPNRRLVEWAEARPRGDGRSAVVVGCGLGDDAEYVASLGYDTTAFDIAPSAIRACQRRFPDSSVSYVVADLLQPPSDWSSGFDLVVESITVQSLPDPPRAQAIANVAALVAPGGTLLVISGAREEGEPAPAPPWPLTRAEVDSFAAGGRLRPVLVEDLMYPGEPDSRRWRAEFAAPDA